MTQFGWPRTTAVVLATVFLTVSANRAKTADERPPNFIIILADDLGYGDLGCYGSRINRTPHIDRLANEGIRFTDFHSNGPMCTPTRAALLTGLYQHRFGAEFEGALSGRTQRDRGLPLDAVTLPELLKKANYATAMFGKWHLGYQAPYLPTRQGFDEFRGLTSGDGDHHSHIDRSGRADWWHNDTLDMEEGYTAELLTDHAIQFIEQHRDESFFVYLPHLAIHFPWQGPDDPPHRREGTGYYSDKWGIIPNPNDVSPHVKAMIESVDESVGGIVAALERLGLAENTLVIFTSDNGGYRHYGNTHHNISSNGSLRGQKGEMFEGGHRVPCIAWWPGRIAPAVCHETAMTFDFVPTLARLSKVTIGQQGAVDGVDITHLLLEKRGLASRTLFWRMRENYAVRRGVWKLVGRTSGEAQLFNLADDLSEETDMATEHPQLVNELRAEYAKWDQSVAQGDRATAR